MSPTQRALAYCKQNGLDAAIVERWIERVRKRIDLFGMFDLVVLDGKPGLLGVQVSTGSGHAERVKKIRESPVLAKWKAAGCRAEVWTWSKRKARKKDGSFSKVYRWTMRVEDVT